MKLCSIVGCDRKYFAKGFCKYHYLSKEGLNTRTHKCTLENCNSGHYAKGFCRKHYTNNKYDKKRTPCKVSTCKRFTTNLEGYCFKHYRQLIKGRPFDADMKGPNNPRWNGGVSEYINHYVFKKARLQKLKQVAYKCEECGVTTRYVHHLDGSKSNHSLENLKALCSKCHIGIYHSDKMGRPPIYGKFTVEELAHKTNTKPYTARTYLIKRALFEPAIKELNERTAELKEDLC